MAPCVALTWPHHPSWVNATMSVYKCRQDKLLDWSMSPAKNDQLLVLLIRSQAKPTKQEIQRQVAGKIVSRCIFDMA
jgi:hypothetical protein